jgi:hypothetical protein
MYRRFPQRRLFCERPPDHNLLRNMHHIRESRSNKSGTTAVSHIPGFVSKPKDLLVTALLSPIGFQVLSLRRFQVLNLRRLYPSRYPSYAMCTAHVHTASGHVNYYRLFPLEHAPEPLKVRMRVPTDRLGSLTLLRCARDGSYTVDTVDPRPSQVGGPQFCS